jgi:3-hydroxyacyl-CoA dehydrogenase
MNKIDKIRILLTVNNMKLNDLVDFVKSGDISVEEMVENGLLGRKSKKGFFEY